MRWVKFKYRDSSYKVDEVGPGKWRLSSLQPNGTYTIFCNIRTKLDPRHKRFLSVIMNRCLKMGPTAMARASLEVLDDLVARHEQQSEVR